jgi:hypothetical protein
MSFGDEAGGRSAAKLAVTSRAATDGRARSEQICNADDQNAADRNDQNFGTDAGKHLQCVVRRERPWGFNERSLVVRLGEVGRLFAVNNNTLPDFRSAASRSLKFG